MPAEEKALDANDVEMTDKGEGAKIEPASKSKSSCCCSSSKPDDKADRERGGSSVEQKAGLKERFKFSADRTK